MVKVSVLTPPTLIRSGANTLAKVGGGSISRKSVAGAATGRPESKSWLVVLRKLPAVAVPGTFTVTAKLQLPPAGRLPPERPRKDAPDSAEPAPQADSGSAATSR